MSGTKTFVAFDFETTGFYPPCKIIEIGAVKFIRGNKAATFQSFINPMSKLPQNIIELTGIDDAMLSGADTFDIVLPRFLNFIGDYSLVAHNAPFDMKFLTHYSGILGYPVNNRIIDTLKLSKACYPTLPCHKLGYLADYLGVSQDTEHRALDDAMAAALIYLDCIKK